MKSCQRAEEATDSGWEALSRKAIEGKGYYFVGYPSISSFSRVNFHSPSPSSITSILEMSLQATPVSAGVVMTSEVEGHHGEKKKALMVEEVDYWVPLKPNKRVKVPT